MSRIVIRNTPVRSRLLRIRTSRLSRSDLRGYGFRNYGTELMDGRPGSIGYVGDNPPVILGSTPEGENIIIVVVDRRYYYYLTFEPGDEADARDYYGWVTKRLSKGRTPAAVGDYYFLRLGKRRW